MNDIYQYERSELAQVRAQLLHLFFIVGIFSFLVNLLLLTGPLYMLHIYDRVLPSGAVQTLVALSLMACLAYAVMGVLDHTRARITARIAVRFLTQLDQRVFSLAMQSAQSGRRTEPQAALKDLTLPCHWEINGPADRPLLPRCSARKISRFRRSSI